MSEPVPHPLPTSLIDSTALEAWFEHLGKPLLVLAVADAVATGRGAKKAFDQARRWVRGEVSEESCLEFARGLPRRVRTAIAARRVLWAAAAKTNAASEATSAVRDVLSAKLGTTDLENDWLKINEDPDPSDDGDTEGIVTPDDLRAAEQPIRNALEPYTRIPDTALDLSHRGASDPDARKVLVDLLQDAGWPPLDA